LCVLCYPGSSDGVPGSTDGDVDGRTSPRPFRGRSGSGGGRGRGGPMMRGRSVALACLLTKLSKADGTHSRFRRAGRRRKSAPISGVCVIPIWRQSEPTGAGRLRILLLIFGADFLYQIASGTKNRPKSGVCVIGLTFADISSGIFVIIIFINNNFQSAFSALILLVG